jgi:hypothetical protein
MNFVQSAWRSTRRSCREVTPAFSESREVLNNTIIFHLYYAGDIYLVYEQGLRWKKLGAWWPINASSVQGVASAHA